MALGFAPAILLHLKTLMDANYAGTKITPSGFLKLAIENTPRLRVTSVGGESVSDLKLSTASGHIREVKYKYLPRIVDTQVADEDTCDNDVMFQYSEGQLAAGLFSKLGFYLDWGFVERYQQEASRLVTTGNPNTTVLNELVEQLMHTVNGIVVNMDKKLLAQVVWGTNVTTGNNSAKTININKQGDVLDLSTGIIELLSDVTDNEISGDVLLAGSGLMNKFAIAKGALSANQSGFNQASLGGYKWYNDLNAAAAWGVNQVGAFAKGAVGLVDIDRYIAWKSGRHGTSTFFQMPLPVETVVGGVPVTLTFNVQIKEIDCPTEVYDGYETRTVDRGYQVIISKAYGLFQPPTSIVQSTDRLNGFNGALRYEITNVCDTCEE